ncbi:MAG TPA: HAD hydrolase family protein [Kofleriaceae bacterium]|nr:HAD hydrolase family protein [Kofleriaceae bacterium]
MTDGLRARLARVRLLGLDVDGVLTDGTLYYGDAGEVLKAFHVRDGLGLRLLLRNGVEVAVISARRGGGLDRRMQEMHIDHYVAGREDKQTALAEVAGKLGLDAAEVAFAGDDLIDLPAMRWAGVAIAVADAHPRVRAEAAWVTAAAGGRGAVREIADALLDAQGKLEGAIEALTRP